MAPKKVYFHHIPKTAGTSVTTWISEAAGLARAPAHLWGGLLGLTRDSLEQYNFFSGHFYRPLAAYLGEDLRVVLFLRNPIDRSISHFEHVLRSSDHYFHDYVSRHKSFLEFVTDPVTRPMVDNFQVRSITTQFDPVALAGEEADQSSKRHELERRIETLPLQGSPETALVAAKDYVTRVAVVGITEQFGRSIRCVAKALNCAEPQTTLRLNAAPSKSVSAERLSAAELEAVITATKLDWALYEYTLGIFERQVRVLADTRDTVT